jgi:hypothetical protein
MTAAVVSIHQSETERRWSAYLVARQKAEQTGRIEDGIAAGEAWAAFLALFVAEGRAHG